MKKLLGLIILFIIAAVVLSLVQYFKQPSKLLNNPIVTPTSNAATSTDKNPLLSEKQEDALIKAGIDPATLPTSITPAMEACFESKLGIERVKAIKAGDLPTLPEIIVAKTCLGSSQ